MSSQGRSPIRKGTDRVISRSRFEELFGAEKLRECLQTGVMVNFYAKESGCDKYVIKIENMKAAVHGRSGSITLNRSKNVMVGKYVAEYLRHPTDEIGLVMEVCDERVELPAKKRQRVEPSPEYQTAMPQVSYQPVIYIIPMIYGSYTW